MQTSEETDKVESELAPRRAEALQPLKNWLKITYISDLDKNKN